MSRRWLRHPPATIGRRAVCPSGLPRFASAWLASAAELGWVGDARLQAADCDQCDGVHLQPRHPAR